ncbi:hypothetical protein [Pseudomonas sp. NPDC089569]|uniref:hypothetical protein n=1 Tax=Pseudomonas sp. NPDC089569 TaxID=3390722 RepID=UPI003D028F19
MPFGTHRGHSRQGCSKQAARNAGPSVGVGAESINWSNLQSEEELMADPFAKDLEGDQRLFIAGWSGKPLLENGEGASGAPIFLLSRELNRVMKAYLDLPRK